MRGQLIFACILIVSFATAHLIGHWVGNAGIAISIGWLCGLSAAFFEVIREVIAVKRRIRIK